MVSKTAFKKSSLKSRVALLKKAGEHLGGRYHQSYAVHLYSIGDFYAELWIRIDLDQICWIEIADPQKVAEDYAGRVDLGELGL